MSVPSVFIDGLEQEHAYDGSPVLWRPTIHGFAVQDKKLFVVRPFGSTILEPPGGKIELGETREHALEREFLEETGYTVQPVSLLGFTEKWLFHQREKRFYHMVMQIWEVNLGEQVRGATDLHEFAGFIPLQELRREQFHAVMGDVVEKLKEKYREAKT